MPEVCAVGVLGSLVQQIGPQLKGSDSHQHFYVQQHGMHPNVCLEGMLQGTEQKQEDKSSVSGSQEGSYPVHEQPLAPPSHTSSSGDPPGPHSGTCLSTESQEYTTVGGGNDMGGNLSRPVVVRASEIDVPETPFHTFVVHAIRAIDPLVGELFICPQTLEVVCLHRMLGLPVTFAWERLPSPAPPWDIIPAPGLLWLSLGSNRTPLPAAVNPKTGGVLSGRRLMEALRKFCIELPVQAAALERSPHSTGLLNRANNGQKCSENSSAGDINLPEHPLCIGTYEARNSTVVERATQLATTEIVQQAVQAALHFYLWKDDGTFLGFTKPMLQNTLGVAYGSYYCWAMRRSSRDIFLSHSSPRLSPDDLAHAFPNSIGPGVPQEAPTVEELLVLDGLRRALRVVEQLLEGRAFFGGSEADAVDAVVFAHLAILFSLPLPDRRELQAILSNRGTLFQYCHRVQADYKVWPAGPSLLFGVLSLSEMAAGMPLRVHSWRQRHSASLHGNDDEYQDAGTSRYIYRLLWWLGAAACCAALLVVAGKTPLRVAMDGPRSENRRSSEVSSYDNESDTETLETHLAFNQKG